MGCEWAEWRFPHFAPLYFAEVLQVLSGYIAVMLGVAAQGSCRDT